MHKKLASFAYFCQYRHAFGLTQARHEHFQQISAFSAAGIYTLLFIFSPIMFWQISCCFSDFLKNCWLFCLNTLVYVFVYLLLWFSFVFNDFYWYQVNTNYPLKNWVACLNILVICNLIPTTWDKSWCWMEVSSSGLCLQVWYNYCLIVTSNSYPQLEVS